MAEIDDIFRQFATAFAGAVKDAKPICFPEQLCRKILDLSLESLKQVDTYLTYLHNHKDEIVNNFTNISTVLYAGAYVGEVIRNETNNHYHWIDYDDYMPAHPDLQALIPERTTSTCAFIVDDRGKMSMPLNKIARFIDEGEENSVYFFAHCDITHANDT